MSEDPSSSAPGFPVPAGVSAEDILRDLGGAPPLDLAQPPPADMPPLSVMILDALSDASETVFSMRNCGHMAPYGLALVGETHLLDALRSLLADGLVEVEDEAVVEGGRLGVFLFSGEPSVAEADLRRYTFRRTKAGETTWKAAEAVLDAYGETHPFTEAGPRRAP